ncbi:hypothetical protein F4813DRAFT_358467 [Daldinia decipiens]|uniref:uncharacterized protein n=1 Tax=Daldinia decipiens TaxID=326647 RepID=UPI0020C425E4|nr:uncharacterized protein F4813DRAFT_358467 [Daldinia decipiens]KAI1657944.1 hypothetical protein F4813DRAFT_358467 [Daldinia decipiens]
MSDQQSGFSARNQGPTVRNPDTGCAVQLSAELKPTGFEHTERCKCIKPGTDGEWKLLCDGIKRAIETKTLDLDKASMVFAELLLGMGVDRIPIAATFSPGR